jgi:hypothetical protein
MEDDMPEKENFIKLENLPFTAFTKPLYKKWLQLISENATEKFKVKVVDNNRDVFFLLFL